MSYLYSVLDIHQTEDLPYLMYRYIGKVEESVCPLMTLQDYSLGRNVIFVAKSARGYVAYLVVEPHKEEALILQAYSIQQQSSKPLFSYMCQWLKEKGFKRVVGYTHHSPLATERVYGMKLLKYKIGKELM